MCDDGKALLAEGERPGGAVLPHAGQDNRVRGDTGFGGGLQQVVDARMKRVSGHVGLLKAQLARCMADYLKIPAALDQPDHADFRQRALPHLDDRMGALLRKPERKPDRLPRGHVLGDERWNRRLLEALEHLHQKGRPAGGNADDNELRGATPRCGGRCVAARLGRS